MVASLNVQGSDVEELEEVSVWAGFQEMNVAVHH